LPASDWRVKGRCHTIERIRSSYSPATARQESSQPLAGV
jgi:hypothetical protein